MSETTGRGRVSAEQLEVLVTFMEEHREFAGGKHALYSRYSSSKLWRLLAERLNAAAPHAAVKSPDKWCRYWTDLKYKVRKKAAGSGAFGELTPAEERLAAILSTTENVSSNRNEETSGAGGSGISANAGPIDDDACSLGSVTSRLAADEILAEAAMRTALAAEKQAEALGQVVNLLRDVLHEMRRGAPPPAQQHPPPPAPHDVVHHMHHRM